MNALEIIGLDKLESQLTKVLENLSEKNEGRQEHLRIHSEGELKRAFQTLKAVRQNTNLPNQQ